MDKKEKSMSKTTKSIIIAASVIIVLIVGTIVISNIDKIGRAHV